MILVPSPSNTLPIIPRGPYRSSSVNPVTEAGIATGKSRTESIKPLKGKSCLTSRRATTVPRAPFITVVANASTTVNCKEKTASREEILSQKTAMALLETFRDIHTSAGSTNTPRNVTTIPKGSSLRGPSWGSATFGRADAPISNGVFIPIGLTLQSIYHMVVAALPACHAVKLDRSSTRRTYMPAIEEDYGERKRVRQRSGVKKKSRAHRDELCVLSRFRDDALRTPSMRWRLGLGAMSSGPHHQDSGESKIRESTAGGSRKPSSDGKACGCSSKHLCGLTAWNT